LVQYVLFSLSFYFFHFLLIILFIFFYLLNRSFLIFIAFEVNLLIFLSFSIDLLNHWLNLHIFVNGIWFVDFDVGGDWMMANKEGFPRCPYCSSWGHNFFLIYHSLYFRSYRQCISSSHQRTHWSSPFVEGL
jgi:hypothetical protein